MVVAHTSEINYNSKLVATAFILRPSCKGEEKLPAALKTF